jgi:hypothetical protein
MFRIAVVRRAMPGSETAGTEAEKKWISGGKWPQDRIFSFAAGESGSDGHMEEWRLVG